MTIAERARHPVDLAFFNQPNLPECVGPLSLSVPWSNQYVLRMLVREQFSDFKIPNNLLWVQPMLSLACENQEKIGIRHPFCYITVRHGPVNTKNDSVWHTDGFSQTVTHLPEQNYIWVDCFPTECATKAVSFPDDFDTFKHNVHLYLQDLLEDLLEDSLEDSLTHTITRCTVYCMDPYVIHRRPPKAKGNIRTLVRVSFTPIEIIDCNNTCNPELPRNYERDGVVDFRDKLERYQL